MVNIGLVYIGHTKVPYERRFNTCIPSPPSLFFHIARSLYPLHYFPATPVYNARDLEWNGVIGDVTHIR